MGKIKSDFKLIVDKSFRTKFLAIKGWYDKYSDEEAIRRIYHDSMGYYADFSSPKTFTEKLNWLKIHDRKPVYSKMADKLEMKKIVEEKVGTGHIARTFKIWDSPSEINFDGLPDSFMLKCSVSSGVGHFVCKKKNTRNLKKAKRALRKGWKRNLYKNFREWPYKNATNRIFAEELLGDGKDALIDYKWFCFNGKARVMYIGSDAGKKPTTDWFDMDFNHLDIVDRDGPSPIRPNKPAEFERMKEIAELLSSGVPFLRVDFYLHDGRIIVGELTFYHMAGFTRLKPESWEKQFGEWINLNNISESKCE